MKDFFVNRPRGKKLIIICAIVLLIAIVLNGIASAVDSFLQGNGTVTSISVRRKGSDEIVLKINYIFATGGYSVREVPLDEGEYIGDGMIDYDGSLGKYRVIISFGDISLSTRYSSKFRKSDNTLKLSNFPAEIRARVASPSDHGFVLYLGSDTPLSVEETKGWLSLSEIGGTVKIPITLKEE